MGKRSSFERRERDFYPTPESAVEPLYPYLRRGFTFFEPCAGDGALRNHLKKMHGICVGATDIEPRDPGITKRDALSLTLEDVKSADFIITNPPWSRDILHPMIYRFSGLRPTWLLFDADWMHTRQASDLLTMCSKIVSVGRVKWIPNSPHTGKDNCAWYLFERYSMQTIFTGRAA